MNRYPIMQHLSCVVLLLLCGCDQSSDNQVNSTVIEQARSEDGTETQSDGTTISYKQRKGSHPLTYAPDKLREILRQKESAIDFRYVAKDGYPYEGCHWRMALNDDVLQAHVERFDLKPVSKGHLTEKLLRTFPSDWPVLSTAKTRWYAWPYNRDDGGNFQIWSVMAVDVEASTLYFFYQNYDVTP